MSKKVIRIDKINPESFTNFIKKLISIDKFIYIKLVDGNIVSNVYLPEHDAIKQQIIPISTLFELDETLLGDNTYKISFYNGNRVIDALKAFDVENIQASVEFEKTESGLIATNFIISNIDETDKIKLACADPSINFMDLTQSQIDVIYNDSDKLFEFNLTADSIKKLENRLNIEKDVDTFKIVLEDNFIWFKSPSDTYNMRVCSVNKVGSRGKDGSVLVYKRYLSLIDSENYTCSVCHNKLILKSLDSETLLSIATCEQD